MPTTKKRVSVTLNSELEKILTNISKQKNLSLSQSIVIFLEKGLENVEDLMLSNLADELDEKTKNYVSHDEFWDDLIPNSL